MRENGRSMVEMLGVLAIIGVLSVGAIAGYSKAMFKYKLNKQAEQLTTLFNAAAQYAGQFTFNNASSNNNITDIFIKLGIVPVEMIDGDNPDYIYDVFNNQVSIIKSGTIQLGNGNLQPDVMSVQVIYDNKENRHNIDVCRNILITGKGNAEILYTLETYDRGDGTPQKQVIYGGLNYCDKFHCIKDLTLAKIEDMCRGFAEHGNQIVVNVSFK